MGSADSALPPYSVHVREARDAAVLTQEEFAKEIGVTKNTVARWETGVREPGLKNYEALLEFCRSRKSQAQAEALGGLKPTDPAGKVPERAEAFDQLAEFFAFQIDSRALARESQALNSYARRYIQSIRARLKAGKQDAQVLYEIATTSEFGEYLEGKLREIDEVREKMPEGPDRTQIIFGHLTEAYLVGLLNEALELEEKEKQRFTRKAVARKEETVKRILADFRDAAVAGKQVSPDAVVAQISSALGLRKAGKKEETK